MATTAYFPAPPLSGIGEGRFMLTPTGNDPDQLRRVLKPAIAGLVAFQAFPGHDWHFRRMAAHADQISAVRWFTPGAVEDSFAMWHDSIATEGWGAHAESLMGEPSPDRPHGFYTAGERLIVLRNQLGYAVGARIDIGLHTGRMTIPEAIDYFIERLAMAPNPRQSPEHPAALSAQRRANNLLRSMVFSVPMLAATFPLGSAAIEDLRADYLAAHPGRTVREFYELRTAAGPIPVGHYRAAFLDNAV